MSARRDVGVWVDGVRVGCARGHRMTPDNVSIEREGQRGERRACRECRRLAGMKAARATAQAMQLRGGKRRAQGPKPALTAFTHNPALLAACRDELAAWSARQLDPLRRLRRGNHIGARRSA